MKLIYTLCVYVLFTFIVTPEANASTVNVNVEDNEFNPDNFTINAGDTIIWRWDNSAGAHTTTSTIIPATATAWDQPINQSSQTFIYIPASSGNYQYRCNFHFSSGMTGQFNVIGNIGINDIASAMVLNLTNPVTNKLQMEYTLMKTTSLNLRLYDIIGNVVNTFISGTQPAGNYNQSFEVSTLSKGIYLLNLETSDGTVSRKVIIQ